MNGKVMFGCWMVMAACARRPLPAAARVDFVRENYGSIGVSWTFETLPNFAHLKLPSRMEEGSNLVSSTCTGTPVEVEFRSGWVVFRKPGNQPLVDAQCDLVAENGQVLHVIVKTRDATVREQEYMERHIQVGVPGGPCPDVLGDRCTVTDPIRGVEGLVYDGKSVITTVGK